MSKDIQLPFNENQRLLLQDIAESVLSTSDWGELVNLIMFSGVRLVNGIGALFSVYDRSLGDYAIQGSYGFEKEQTTNAMNFCKEFLVNRNNNDSSRRERIYQIPYEQIYIYILPLKRNTIDTGILALSANKKELTEEQYNLLEAFIQTVSIAVENSRLYLQIQRQSKSLTIMNKLNRLVGKGSFQEILTETVTRIGNLFNAKMAGIMLYDSDQNQLVLQKPAFGVWDDAIIEQYRVSLKEGGNAVSVFLSGIPTITNNAHMDSRYLLKYVLVFDGTKSIMTVPLSVDERRIGVLHAMRKEENMFTQDDLALLIEISDHLGVILDGALSMKGKSNQAFQRTEIEQYFSRQLVYGMLHGQERELEYVKVKGNMLKLPVNPPFTVMSIGLYGKGQWYNTGLKEKTAAIEQTVKKMIPISGVWIEDDHFTIIYGSESPDNIKDIAVKIKREAEKLFKPKNAAQIFIGMGKPVQSLNMIKESFQEAQLTLKVLPQIPNSNAIGHYLELGLWSLLAELTSRKEVTQMYIHHHLKDINRMKNADEVKETLKVYLLKEGQLKNTAAALFIHPNTLKYRIQRIEEETGIDLSHPEIRLNMNIALRLEHLLS